MSRDVGPGGGGRCSLLTPGLVPAERTVTVGVGHGKKAARNIDAWLRHGHETPISQAKHDIVAFGQLNLWYFGDAAQRQQPAS